MCQQVFDFGDEPGAANVIGRGMGLARVYSIAGANGWWLDVRSTPGDGTEVKVLFPWHERGADAESR
jgi:sensor histidine kinase regulating citrate/malate metabolism